MRLVYHPAGRDRELYGAAQDLRAGRWLEMRRVLAGTSEWSAWTTRTQVLGAAAARSNLVELWMEEEPDSADARVMYARVTTQRALHAHRTPPAGRKTKHISQWEEHTRLLADNARQACLAAVDRRPEDPVPWICRVALAELDTTERRPEHCAPPPPPEMLLPQGPWGLLEEANKRDPLNREGWHRMLRVLRTHGRQAGIGQAVAMYFARWAVCEAPPGSPLLLLPLYARMEEYQDRRARGDSDDTGAPHPYPADHEPVAREIHRAFHDWFRRCDPSACSLTDLNHVAHALYTGGLLAEGAEVFRVIEEFATPAPWQYLTHDPNQWQQAFLAARASCLEGKPKRRGPRD